MQLTYRGNKYQLQSLSKDNLKNFTGVIAKYRGTNYYVLSTTIECDRALIAYKYRGIDYIKENIEKSLNKSDRILVG